MPYAHALEALRRVLLRGDTLLTLALFDDIAVLILYTLVFIPLGLLAFRWGYNKVRMEGTTASY